MGMISLLNEDNEAYTSMQVLNEAETNNQSSVSLSYDVPAKNEGLFAVFYTNKGCYYKKIEGNSVSFAEASEELDFASAEDSGEFFAVEELDSASDSSGSFFVTLIG